MKLFSNIHVREYGGQSLEEHIAEAMLVRHLLDVECHVMMVRGSKEFSVFADQSLNDIKQSIERFS